MKYDENYFDGTNNFLSKMHDISMQVKVTYINFILSGFYYLLEKPVRMVEGRRFKSTQEEDK